MNFGDRLEELRKERGWTQRELADNVEVSERTYQLWRSGRADPNGKHRKKLAEVLGVPLAYLTDESGDTQGTLDRMEEKLDRTEEELSRMGKKLDRLLAHLGA